MFQRTFAKVHTSLCIGFQFASAEFRAIRIATRVFDRFKADFPERPLAVSYTHLTLPTILRV